MTTLLETDVDATECYLRTLRNLQPGKGYTEQSASGQRRLTLLTVNRATRTITCADSFFNELEFTFNANQRIWISNTNKYTKLEVSDYQPYPFLGGRVGLPLMPQPEHEAPEPFSIIEDTPLLRTLQ